MQSVDVEGRTYISPQQDGMWYFVKTKDGDLAAMLLMVDREGKGYFSDLTRAEIAALFKGWHEANAKMEFEKGGTEWKKN